MRNRWKSASPAEESLLAAVKRLASLALLALVFGASPAFAQQSLFNVPSTTMTPKDEVFLQEQLNLGAVGGESNLTMDYGLGTVDGVGEFELGLNVLHVDIYGSEQDDGANDFAVNGSWLTRLTPELHLQLGAQVGTGTAVNTYVPFVWAWSTLRGEFPEEWGAIIAGAYTGSTSSLGRGVPIGGLLGVEVAMVRHVISFMGDILLGENDASVAVLGLVVFLPADWQLSAGVQLPCPGTNNPIEAVFELTRAPQPSHAHTTSNEHVSHEHHTAREGRGGDRAWHALSQPMW